MAAKPDLLKALQSSSRLRALVSADLLDTPPEAQFDRYTKLARQLLGAETALISLVDDQRQFFKSAIGLGEPWTSNRQTPLSHSLCKHVVADRQTLAIEHAKESAYAANMAVTELGVQAYAGVPLEHEGEHIGALCVLGTSPRPWTEEQLEILRALAAGVSTEIALRSREREVAEAKALLNAITESAQDVIVTADAEGTILFCNRATETVFMHKPEDLQKKPLTCLMPERFREAHRQGLMRVNAGGDPHVIGRVVELQGLRSDGTEFPLELSVSCWQGRKRTFYTGILRDISERTRALRALRDAEEQFRLTHELAPIGMALVAPDGHWLRVNQALCTIVGYSNEELLKIDFQAITHPDDLGSDLEHLEQLLLGSIQSYQLEKRYIHRDGHVVWALLTVALARDETGAPSFFISQVQDITRRMELEEQIRQSSLTDELTGLRNRRGFMVLGEQQLLTATRYGRSVVVLFADLNGLKRVNDELGHEEGDRLLVDMADVLRGTFRRADVIARLGGDEFVVMAEGDRAFATSYERRLAEEVQAHNARSEKPYPLSASLGAAYFDPAEPRTVAELLAVADAAMYAAKKRQRC